MTRPIMPGPLSASATSPPLLTGRQLQIVAAIEDLTDRAGYPPNLREVAAHIGVAAVSGLHYQLSQLRARGVVTWTPQCPRTLRVLHRSTYSTETDGAATVTGVVPPAGASAGTRIGVATGGAA